jgi:signal peptidase
MEPACRKYAVVLVKNDTYDDVEAGELVAFTAEALGGKPAFHRVVEVTPDGFVTKGDANKINDGQIVNRDSFLGREVWHTNLTADLIPLLTTPKGALFLVALPVLLIFLTVVFIKILRNLWKKNETAKRGCPACIRRLFHRAEDPAAESGESREADGH